MTTRAVFLGLCLLLIAGCDDDPARPRDDDSENVIYEATTTPDALVRNFVKAYNARDFLAYDQMRHVDFLFEFASQDIGSSGEPNGIWARQRDSEATQKMLTGIPGAATPAIQSIELTLTQRTAGWVPATEPELAGTLKKTFAVAMRVTLTSGDIFAVEGGQDFYAINVAAVGEPANFQLYYWRDLGFPEKAFAPSGISWGVLKASY